MNMIRLYFPFVLLVLMGGCATTSTPANSSQGDGTDTSAMTVGECQNLGCSVREGANCPEIRHDHGTRRWACQCAGGSSCITENSPQ